MASEGNSDLANHVVITLPDWDIVCHTFQECINRKLTSKDRQCWQQKNVFQRQCFKLNFELNICLKNQGLCFEISQEYHGLFFIFIFLQITPHSVDLVCVLLHFSGSLTKQRAFGLITTYVCRSHSWVCVCACVNVQLLLAWWNCCWEWADRTVLWLITTSPGTDCSLHINRTWPKSDKHCVRTHSHTHTLTRRRREKHTLWEELWKHTAADVCTDSRIPDITSKVTCC